jgi:hypothetical protein
MAPRKNESPVPDPEPLVKAQPQSPQLAAPQREMFLYTNDSWSRNYFDVTDLHCLERQLFA